MPLARGFFYLIQCVMWVILVAARHWFVAWLLVVWPEVVVLYVLILARPRERDVAGAWATWLGVTGGVQALGVWIAIQKGWAGTEDVPAVVVSAFVSSLVALPAATWLALVVVDKLAPSQRFAKTPRRPLP